MVFVADAVGAEFVADAVGAVVADAVAVVTGGNRGIGREVCRQLADLGYRVVLTSRDAGAAEEVAGRLGVDHRRLDVTSDESVRDLAAYVEERYGRLDVLVNNAAVHYDSWQRAAGADLAVVREAMETNFYGPWRMVLALLPLLREGSHGRIVNVSSEAASFASLAGGGWGHAGVRDVQGGVERVDGDVGGGVAAGSGAGQRRLPGVGGYGHGWAGGRPVAEGAASVVWGVTLPDDGPTGGFFRDGRRVPW
nr:SDR family NAD(P)-dependent oxidoreductase [Saccharothrix mutabilis subsp. capreolus]